MQDIKMYNVNYQDALSELKQSICEVTFTKVNGDTRVMTCTLQKDMIPQATKKDPLTETKVREINENFISVWDINAKGWRGFRVANVIAFKQVDNV
jgi:hypothetical protein